MKNRVTSSLLAMACMALSACEPPTTPVIISPPPPPPPPAPVVSVQPPQQQLAEPYIDPNYVNPVEESSIFDSGETQPVELIQ
jgi:hypothetical protein